MLFPSDKKILLVEDDFIIGYSQQKELESKGYNVVILNSPESVLKSIFEDKNHYDLILMDIDIGSKIDGTELASIILQKIHIPILFLSSHIEEDIVTKTEAITSYGYVVKKSGITVLDASIKMAFKLHKVNKVLHFKKDYLEAVLRSIGDAVVVTDTSGKVTNLNPMAEKLTGWKFEEANNKNLNEIFRIEDSLNRQSIEDPVQKVLNTDRAIGLSNHTILISKQGEEFQIADSGSPIKNLKGETTGVVLVFRDVTKEYESQTLIAQREKMYRSLFENMLNGFCHCKIIYNADGKVDFEYILVNPAFEKLTGIKNAIGKKVSDLIPGILEHDSNTILTALETVSTGRPKTFESYLKTLDRWLILSCYSLDRESLFMAFDDITPRKKSEELLRYQANLLENVKDSIIGTDEFFRVTYWNQGAANVYGWSKEEALGQLTTELLNTNYDAISREEILKDLNKNGMYFAEFSQKTKDGRQITVESHTSKVLNSEGLLNGYISVSRDITERKKTLDELKYSEDKLNGIIESAMDAIISINEENQIVVFNSAAEQMFQYKSKDIIGQNVRILTPSRIHSEYYRNFGFFADFAPMNRSKNILEKTTGIRSNGEEFPIEAAVSQIQISGSKIQTAIIRDDSIRLNNIQKIEELLNEKDILLKEVNHRTKNNLFIIYSLLQRQSEMSGDGSIEGSLLDAASRVKSMIVLYEKLYTSNQNIKSDLVSYLQLLINELIDIFPLDIDSKFNGPDEPIILDAKILSAMGIIMNELMTNSLKYAFTEKSKNSFQVSIKCIENRIYFYYSDSGTDLSNDLSDRSSYGFGFEFIKGLVAGMNGKFEYELEKNLKVTIEFPT